MLGDRNVGRVDDLRVPAHQLGAQTPFLPGGMANRGRVCCRARACRRRGGSQTPGPMTAVNDRLSAYPVPGETRLGVQQATGYQLARGTMLSYLECVDELRGP